MFRQRNFLDFDMMELDKLVVQSAACVLVVCNERDPKGAHQKQNPTDAIGAQLNEFLACGSGWYTHLLQAQVDLIYDFVGLMIEDHGATFTIDMEEASLIVAALSAYQELKTELVGVKGLSPDPSDPGKNPAFSEMDWTDLNDKLMELLQQPT